MKRANVVCPYCTALVAKAEREHVFPESWYPAGTRQQDMLKVPACSRCNRQYGQVEDRLRHVLALGLDPGNPAHRDVLARAWRAIAPQPGDNFYDRMRREGRRRKLWASVKPVTAAELGRVLPRTGRMPGPQMMRLESGVMAPAVPGIRFDPNDMQRLAEKLTRGVYYHHTGEPLPLAVPLDTPFLTKNPVAMARSIIEKLQLEPHGMPETFMYWGGVAAGDPHTSIWLFAVWDQLLLLGLTGQMVRNSREAAADGER